MTTSLKHLWMLLLVGWLLYPPVSPPAQTISEEQMSWHEVMQLGYGTVASATWSPDGQAIAVGGDKGIRLYTASLEPLLDINTQSVTNEEVRELSWQPNGILLANDSGHGVTIWNTEKGQLVYQLPESAGRVSWSPDGKYLAVSVDGLKAQIWDVTAQRVISVYQAISSEEQPPVRGRFQDIAWSSDGNSIAAYWNNTVQTWNPNTGQTISSQHFSFEYGYSSMEWNPDNTKLAFEHGDPAEILTIWDTETGKLITDSENLEYQGIPSVSWSPDGTKLAGIRFDQSISIWDARTWKQVIIIERPGKQYEVIPYNNDYENNPLVVWSPDGSKLLSSTAGMVRLWDADTGQLLGSLDGYMTQVNTVTWSTDGTHLATGHGAWYGGGDKRFRVWDATTGKPLATCEGSDGIITSLTWQPTGELVASSGGGISSNDNFVRLWNPDTCELVDRWEVPMVISVPQVAWSPNGEWLVSTDSNQVHNMFTGKISFLADILDYGITWSPDSNFIAASQFINGLAAVRIWNPSTGARVTTLQAHPGSLDVLAWSPDGTRLAGVNGTIFADLEDSFGDNNIRIWDVNTGQIVRVFEGHKDKVISVAWSPDGTQIVSGSADHTVRLWDIATGEMLAVLQGHTGIVTSVAWSPDGTKIASGSYDKTVRIWAMTR